MNIKISTRTKIIAFISLIFIIPLTISVVGDISVTPSGIIQVRGAGTGEIYVQSGDLVKNFEFETFNGLEISEGGGFANNKLKFEISPTWQFSQDDVYLQYYFTEGDIVYVYYKLQMHNTLNIYTNVRLVDACEIGSLDPIAEALYCGSYTIYTKVPFPGGLNFGWPIPGFYVPTASEQFTGYWNHYDFGNIKEYNTQNNHFSGDLKCSFDITPNPLPTSITDGYGNDLTKDFDYISISSIVSTESTHGNLSNDLPTIIGLTPAEYDTSQEEGIEEETSGFMTTTRESFVFDPNYNLTLYPNPINSYDDGLNYPSDGTSLNPKTKEGAPIWNAQDTATSMENASFTYNIGSISPVVLEWGAQCQWNWRDVHRAQDFYGLLYPLIGIWQTWTSYDNSGSKSSIGSTALHVINRYIQSDLTITFNVVTQYQINVDDNEIENFNLNPPVEYYDSLIWNTSIEGFGGATITDVSTRFDIISFLLILLWIFIGFALVYLVIKIVPRIVPRRGSRATSTVNVNT